MAFFNYSKPGPGVDKNGPRKKGIFLFFEILWRKLGKIATSNMVYVLFSLPVFLVLYLCAMPLTQNIVGELLAKDSMIESETLGQFFLAINLFFTFTVSILFGSGPASAALSYIHRCFVREEHAWAWGDTIRKIKENLKPSLIVTVINILLVNIFAIAIMFYYRWYQSTHQTFIFVIMCIVIMCFVIFTFMNFYVYQLINTFDAKISVMYKNAFLLVLLTFPMDLFITLIVGVISYFIYTGLNPALSIILSVVILPGLLRFPIEYYAAKVIKKKMIDQIKEEPEETQREAEDEE